jgi:cell wall-associated NlpC family hydrolase
MSQPTCLYRSLIVAVALAANACGNAPTQKVGAGGTAWQMGNAPRSPVAQEKANEVVLFALGLMNIGYRFGGKNPEAGLDCSGMVNYVFSQSAGLELRGSAADIAERGRPVGTGQIYPGDLVFFNTMNRPRSHVGIYIGEGRFIHAPSDKGKVRIDSLTSGWFATRFEEARSYFN